jgi:hypothetical protein
MKRSNENILSVENFFHKEKVISNKMHYKDLFKAAELFRNNPNAWDLEYFKARCAVDWRNLHEASSYDVKRVVLGFLNKWKCRIPVTDELVEKIKSTHRLALPYLDALNGETLEDIDFDKKKIVGSEREQMWNSKIIRVVFTMYSSIGGKFKWVAASKTLHMINPKLFVMWDNSICNSYQLKLDAPSYSYKFLQMMKKEANEAINTYMLDHNLSREEAVKQIESKFNGKTLAKLVDEYNWIKYTAKQL